MFLCIASRQKNKQKKARKVSSSAASCVGPAARLRTSARTNEQVFPLHCRTTALVSAQRVRSVIATQVRHRPRRLRYCQEPDRLLSSGRLRRYDVSVEGPLKQLQVYERKMQTWASSSKTVRRRAHSAFSRNSVILSVMVLVDCCICACLAVVCADAPPLRCC